MENYFAERNNKNAVKLRKIKSELPFFCEEFFLGIDSKTSMLTKVNYATDLKIFFNFLVKEIYEFNGKTLRQLTLDDLNNVTATHIEMYLDYLSYYEKDEKSYSNSNKTKARKISALRSFFKYLYKKDRIKENVITKVDLPKINDKEIVRLSTNEVTNILNLAENGNGFSKNQRAFFEKTQKRDFAMLSLFLGTGIRISELVGLNVNDFNFEDNSFVVTRKGGNRMILYYSDEVRVALIDYIEFRKSKEKENFDLSSPFFLSLQNKRINVRSVENLVKKYAKVVSPLKKITPHKLRSTFGTNLYEETKDIYVVAEVLGHKDVNTTKKHYSAISEGVRREALSGVKLRKDDNEN